MNEGSRLYTAVESSASIMAPGAVNRPPALQPANLWVALVLRPHWKPLTLALVAVFGETIADILQPWPIKVVIDNIVQSKKLPGWIGGIVSGFLGGDKYATLNFAVAAVAIIAVISAVSTYWEKYLTTSVSQWVAHDLRRALYQHIQRLSLAEHT